MTHSAIVSKHAQKRRNSSGSQWSALSYTTSQHKVNVMEYGIINRLLFTLFRWAGRRWSCWSRSVDCLEFPSWTAWLGLAWSAAEAAHPDWGAIRRPQLVIAATLTETRHSQPSLWWCPDLRLTRRWCTAVDKLASSNIPLNLRTYTQRTCQKDLNHNHN